jgi:hypothetical protein
MGQSVAVADLNSDGLTDVAVSDFLTDSVQLFLGRANAGFEATTRLATGRGPRAVVAADLNNDGMVDLAVGEFLSGSVRIFMGNGDGQFANGNVLSLTQGTSSLAAHDLDSDGWIDLAAANVLSGAIDILKNDKGASFGVSQRGSVSAPTLLLFEDVNRDDIQDLVAVDAEGYNAQVFTGGLGGLFQDTYIVESSWITALADASLNRPPTPGISRLTKISGDGQAQQAGGSAREALVVEVRDFTGVPSDGEWVAFSRISGQSTIIEPRVLGSSTADMRSTSDGGRVSLDLLLPQLPDAGVMAASMPPNQVATFAFVSLMKNDDIVQMIESAIVAEIQDVRLLASTSALIANTLHHLNNGDLPAAIRDLAATLDQLPMNAAGSTENLARRLLNQLLLMGPSSDPDNESIVCDVPLSRTIATTAEVDRFTFSSVASERVHITIGNEGGTFGFNPQWRLLDPSDNGVSGCDTFSGTDRSCTLPVVGTYAIEVEDGGFDATGTYSVHIQRLTAAQRCGTAIACDVAITTSISLRADTDLHQFTAVAGELMHITIGNEGGTFGFNPVWRLIAPDPSQDLRCGTATGVDVCMLTDAGDYAIEVQDGGFDATGNYSLHIQRLTPTQWCGTAIACDVAGTSTLSPRADTDLHQFTAAADGELVHITIGNEGGTFGFNPVWRLVGALPPRPLAPEQINLQIPRCDTFSGTERSCTLYLAGPYAIEVQDSGFDAIGNYSVHIQRLTATQRCGTAITCDVAVTTSINPRADTDLYQFTGVAGELMHITLGNEGGGTFGFNPAWRLIDPNANGVSGCDTFSGTDRTCTLSEAGPYAIEVQDSGFDATGNYSVHIQRLTAAQRCGTAITCDVAVTTSISIHPRADTDLHQFTAVAGELMHITIGNEGGTFGFNPVWRLIDPSANGVSGCDTFSGTDRTCTLSEAGPYAIEVEDSGFDATGNYSLQIQRLTAAQRCGTAIACGVPATTTVSARADTDLHQFAGIAGDVVHVSLENLGGTFGFSPVWRLVAPDASFVAGCDTFSGATRDCTLPSTGAYAIEVEDGGFDATGSYRLTQASLSGCVAVPRGVPPPAPSGKAVGAPQAMLRFDSWSIALSKPL